MAKVMVIISSILKILSTLQTSICSAPITFFPPNWLKLSPRINFSKENLISKSLSVDKDIDVIFLRNVLIYFDPPTQKTVVRRLAEHLRPSGYLILGHTEAAIGNEMGFEQVGTGVFCVK